MSDSEEEFQEEIVAEEEVENPAGVIKKLRERLAKAEADRQEYLDGWQRSRADFANLKKDEQVRTGHTQERLKASLAEEMIPILDSFEMASQHSQSPELEMLHKQFLDAIKKMGIERFGKPGEHFDPRKHEALREVSVDTQENDHRVVSIERSGYSIGNYIIRPAQVSVGIHRNK
jgi:molecular chaperone GrpE